MTSCSNWPLEEIEMHHLDFKMSSEESKFSDNTNELQQATCMYFSDMSSVNPFVLTFSRD